MQSGKATYIELRGRCALTSEHLVGGLNTWQCMMVENDGYPGFAKLYQTTSKLV
jgi:hypothetical protein